MRYLPTVPTTLLLIGVEVAHMKLALESSSFFSSAIRQDLLPVIVLPGQAFVVCGPARTGRGQPSCQPTNDISSEIQAVGHTEPMCRIETFGSAGGAKALSDEFIESYGFAMSADKSEMSADSSEMSADGCETRADKSETTAYGSETRA